MKNLLICTVIAFGLTACGGLQKPMLHLDVREVENSCKEGNLEYNYGWRDGKMYVLDVRCRY